MHRLTGLNILLVEDEAMIGLDVANLLARATCRVLGPYADVISAMAAVHKAARIDCAILDIKVGNEHTLAIADAMSARKVPFIWVSGYMPDVLPERYRDRPFIEKPFLDHQLLDAIDNAVTAQFAKPK